MKVSRRQFVAGMSAAGLWGQGKGRLARKDSYFGLHFDLHPNHRDTALGRDLTPEMAGRLLDRVKPDYVQYDCKGHIGYLGYPSKVSKPAAGIVKDSLAIWRAETARRGVGLYIHFSGVWDSLAIQEHPEWAAVRADGTPDPNATSVFGEYVDRRMIPQLKEAMDRYDLDGAWVDGECWAQRLDYGEKPVAAFRRATGLAEAPKGPGDRGWAEWLTFHREAFRKYLRHYLAELKKHRSSFQVASNWMYTTYVPERPEIGVDFISGDYLGNASISTARTEARYLSAVGKPWDLMAWGFQHSPTATIQLNHKTAAQLQQEAAIVLAQGGGFQIYYQPTRAGYFDDRLVGVMERVARFCRERQAVSHQTEAVPGVGVLLSTRTLYGHTNKLFGGWGAALNPVRGMVDALCGLHYSVDVVPEWKLGEVAGRYGAIVVPDWVDVGLAVKAELVKYARGGGAVVICGAENAELFAPELGVVMKGEAGKTAAYVAGTEVIGNVSGVWQEVAAGTAKVLAERYPTYDTTRDGVVAATVNGLGAGKIAAIYGPVGTAYATAHGAATRELIGRVVGEVYEGDVKVDGPAGVEVSLRRKGGRLLAHLVNTTGMQVAAEYAVVERVPAVGPVRVSLRMKARPGRVVLDPGGREVRGEWKEGWWTGEVDRVEVHAVLVVEG